MNLALKEYNQLQMKEMERHKWIESEKAGCDLGELCLIDWIKKHGHLYRQYMMTLHRKN
jgi:hypothetical protein